LGSTHHRHSVLISKLLEASQFVQVGDEPTANILPEQLAEKKQVKCVPQESQRLAVLLRTRFGVLVSPCKVVLQNLSSTSMRLGFLIGKIGKRRR
jgi:hypothetical protein